MTKKKEPGEKKGRYRKVEVRMWGDERFCRLTPIPPCGQGLFFYLITGPHTGPIPGLFCAGRAAMAEALGWEPEAFDQAFLEAFREGLAVADWKARVVWVPKAIRHNKPESPNVITSWGAEFDLIPECDLKWKAREELESSIHALGEAYGKAFDKAFAKPSGKGTGKTTGNQEQEQEQEQKINTPLPPKGVKARQSGPVMTEDLVLFDQHFWPEYPKKADKQAAYKRWKALKVTPALLTEILAGLAKWKAHENWTKEKGQYRHNAATWLHKELWKDEEVCGQRSKAASVAVPQWCVEAGFTCEEEAASSMCWKHTADQFRDGKRIPELTD